MGIPDGGRRRPRDSVGMELAGRTRRHARRPQPLLLALLGLGLVYLALLAGFTLAFADPSLLGWGGFGVVAVVVLAVAVVGADALARSDRPGP